MKIFENIINHKVSNITAPELLKYSKQFKIALTNDEAEKLANHLHGKKNQYFQPIRKSTIS